MKVLVIFTKGKFDFEIHQISSPHIVFTQMIKQVAGVPVTIPNMVLETPVVFIIEYVVSCYIRTRLSHKCINLLI